MLSRLLPSLIFAAAVAAAACGSSEEDAPASNADFPEGRVRMEIEYLDTGLLKGHGYADAAEGWRVVVISVSAVDPDGGQWSVIEPPGEQIGFGSSNAAEFFEVRLEELPRGQQITIKQSVVFEDGGGNPVERVVEDHWPP
jgi:hypothetical protein